MFVTLLLERAGHRVVAAADGRQALRLAAEQPGAMVLADALLEAIAGEPINGIGVTASAGVASWNVLFDRPMELLDAADKALYEAKHRGRAHARSWESLTGVQVG